MKKYPSICFLAVFLLFSCSNLFNDGSASSSEQSGSETVCITGTVSINGAIPSEIMNLFTPQNEDRAAIPSFSSTSTVTYFYKNYETELTNESTTAGEYKFSLPINRTYKIKAGIRIGQTIIMEDEWDEFMLERSNISNIPKNFTLKPKSGNGYIELIMTVPNSVKSVKAACSDPDWDSEKIEITTNSQSVTFKTKFLSATDIKSLPSKNYEVTLNFYDSSNILVYSTTQSITVFAGMTTNKWYDSANSSSSPINNSEGTFELTEDLIAAFARTQIYVGSTSVGTASASGTGSPYAPFESFSHAVSKIISQNSASIDYTIWITGNHTGNQIIPATLTTTENAKSITISGTQALVSGVPQDVFDAGGTEGCGTVLEINSNVPVSIKNLKITGGYATGSNAGGGIYINSNADVSICNGALITGNKTVNFDGGIYVKGKLTLAGGEVSNNQGNNGGIYVDSSTTATINIKGNPRVINNKDNDGNNKNIYLPTGTSGKILNITGALTEGASIGIYTSEEPSVVNQITVTSNYSQYNGTTTPGTYFTADRGGITFNSANTEAIVTESGGYITIEPLYDDITISVDKTLVLKTAVSKTFTFTAKGTKDGITSEIPVGSGENKVSYTYEVTCQGDTVTPASTYYTTDTNTLTFLDTLPAGLYTINVTAVYNGKSYSAGFDVKLFEGTLVTEENINSLSLEDGKEYYFVMDSTVSTDMLKVFLEENKSIGKSTLDLSKMSGNISIFTSTNVYYNNNISTVILNDTTTLSTFNLRWACLLPNVERYIVPESSVSLVSVDGVIYNKTKTELVLYPPQKTGTFEIPDTVISIRNCAFQYVQHLSSITIPARVTSIGMDIFYQSNLQTLTSYSTKVSQEAFMECTNLHTVNLKGNVTEIGSNAFYDCTSLEKITLPASVEKINFRSFGNCPSTVIVNFRGTEEQKNAITNTDTTNNSTFMNDATWIYNYTGD